MVVVMAAIPEAFTYGHGRRRNSYFPVQLVQEPGRHALRCCPKAPSCNCSPIFMFSPVVDQTAQNTKQSK